jgi:serpin B
VLARDTRPAVAAATLNALEAGNTAAALDLYHVLAAKPGNAFLSPYSVSTALMMAAAGARGETLTQMLAVLHATLPPSTLHAAANALNLALLAPRPLQLQIANAVWGQTGYPIKQQFLDTLAREYGAALGTLDYQRDPAGAVKAINFWVDANTNHMIHQLFDSLDPSTRLVLANAVHFKAEWIKPFTEEETRPGPFHTAVGTTVSVPFMKQSANLGYASGDGWQAVDLPYVGGASMTVILPDAGRFDDVERSLDPSHLGSIAQSLRTTSVDLSLPKLRLEDRSNLVPALTRLGMTDAFGNADFSGITGTKELHISQVVHDASIDVDEKGTEAAAATGIVIAVSGRVISRSVKIDRPYIFLIRDSATNTILFLGRVTDPTQTSVEHP